MQIDREALRRNYRSMSDEELLELDPGELTAVARECYDAEVAERQLLSPAAEEAKEVDEEPAEPVGDEPPDWMETAECACSFQTQTGRPYAAEGDQAAEALRGAGVPCEVIYEEAADDIPGMLKVMVPSALSLKASSVLDTEIFNQEFEDNLRTHFEHFSDRELRALHPDAICAGLLDRAERLKRLYEEEIDRRHLKA